MEILNYIRIGGIIIGLDIENKGRWNRAGRVRSGIGLYAIKTEDLARGRAPVHRDGVERVNIDRGAKVLLLPLVASGISTPVYVIMLPRTSAFINVVLGAAGAVDEGIGTTATIACQPETDPVGAGFYPGFIVARPQQLL